MSPDFDACGVITITTDFGHKGPFIGTMKGVMLTRCPDARIVDLTHETLVHWPAEAGFWLARAYPYFPIGTVHVAVVDPGVGTSREIIALVRDGHLFLAPDNGLLGELAEDDRTIVRRVADTLLERLGIRAPSATFHGRDIFAPVAAEFASGRLLPAEVGPLAENVVPSWLERPGVTDARIDGVVITADNFGNLITNLDASLLASFERPVVSVSNHEIPLRRTYADVEPGQYLALINSFGVLEIARAEQSAAEGLGIGRGAPVRVTAGS